jgi:hypothetical protein
MARVTVACLLLLLAGCATTVRPVMTSSAGTHTLTGKNTGIGATGDDVLAELHKKAAAYCGQQRVEVARSDTVSAGLARFPEARLEFRCVPK